MSKVLRLRVYSYFFAYEDIFICAGRKARL